MGKSTEGSRQHEANVLRQSGVGATEANACTGQFSPGATKPGMKGREGRRPAPLYMQGWAVRGAVQQRGAVRAQTSAQMGASRETT